MRDPLVKRLFCTTVVQNLKTQQEDVSGYVHFVLKNFMFGKIAFSGKNKGEGTTRGKNKEEKLCVSRDFLF